MFYIYIYIYILFLINPSYACSLLLWVGQGTRLRHWKRTVILAFRKLFVCLSFLCRYFYFFYEQSFSINLFVLQSLTSVTFYIFKISICSFYFLTLFFVIICLSFLSSLFFTFIWAKLHYEPVCPSVPHKCKLFIFLSKT